MCCPMVKHKIYTKSLEKPKHKLTGVYIQQHFVPTFSSFLNAILEDTDV